MKLMDVNANEMAVVLLVVVMVGVILVCVVGERMTGDACEIGCARSRERRGLERWHG